MRKETLQTLHSKRTIGDAMAFCKRERAMGCAWKDSDDDDEEGDTADTALEAEDDTDPPSEWQNGWCFASDPLDAEAIKCYEFGNDKSQCSDSRDMGCRWMTGDGEPEDWEEDGVEESEPN